jgi:hypothetical protein
MRLGRRLLAFSGNGGRRRHVAQKLALGVAHIREPVRLAKRPCLQGRRSARLKRRGYFFKSNHLYVHVRCRISAVSRSCYYARIEQQTDPAMSIFFDCEIAQESSRRQLRASILMVAVMATAAFVIGFATPINSARKAKPTPPNDAFTGRLVMVTK